MLLELRTYQAADGKVDALHRRFHEATLPAFQRAGITVVGVFTPEDDPNSVVYITVFPDEATRQETWARFNSDEQWLRAKAESEQDGSLIAARASKVIMSTPYSPPFLAGDSGSAGQ